MQNLLFDWKKSPQYGSPTSRATNRNLYSSLSRDGLILSGMVELEAGMVGIERA